MAPRFTREEMTKAAQQHGLDSNTVIMSFGASVDALNEALDRCDVLLMIGPADLSAARDAPRLRWIHYTSAGVEALQGAPIPAHVTVTNASGNHDQRAAEFSVTALLMLNNRIPFFVTRQRAHRWSPVALDPIAGKKVAILGMGALGKAAARMAKLLEMQVIGISRTGRPDPLFDRVHRNTELHAALAEADFLLITLPQTPQTTGMIDANALDRLPTHAGVINIGRSPVLDWRALAERLQAGTLGGAVLDVFDEEPLPPDSPLWTTPNLIIVPHSGLYDEGYPIRCRTTFFEKLAGYLAGRRFDEVVDLNEGY